MEQTFYLRKLKSDPGDSFKDTIQYQMGEIALNPLLGKNISLNFTGKIQCVHCSREIKKTFMDGYCYPCFQSLARCDFCILKPELCHYHKGTCREPKWGEENCLIKHVVYLSNTSGLKVGITRQHKKFERWVDQGAVEAVVLAVVPERLISGQMEIQLANEISDKTDWRALILGKIKEVDLLAERERISKIIHADFASYLVDFVSEEKVYKFNYPILNYPQKVKSHNFDKEHLLEGQLEGIRGQYIFVGDKAVNARKYAGYEMNFVSSN